MRLKIIYLCIFINTLLVAQDLHVTQFFAAPLYLNPAFTGANVCSRVAGTYRNQWPGINKTYSSYLLSYDHSIVQYNCGIGFMFTNDIAGSGKMKTTTISGSFAYDVSIKNNLGFRFGINTGVGLKSINYNGLLFGDQIARGGNVPTVEDPAVNRAYFDVSVGALVFSKKYWGGFSLFHLTKPDESLLGQYAYLPAKFSIHGGTKIALNDVPEEDEQKFISPAFNYRAQQEFDQLDVGFYFSRGKVHAGLWYRGIPLFKAYKKGYPNNDAIALMLGFSLEKFNIGYSYDVTISWLSTNSAGAHEITLSHQFCTLKSKKRKTKMIVPCPKF
jgi:type IX secretion system PorP/SprF family membrane protein